MNFLGMGPLELVVIAALALVIFGPDKLPEMAQQIGRVVREVRRMSREVTDEFQKSIEPETRPTPHQAPPPPPPQSVSGTTSEASSPKTVSQKENNIEPPY